MKLEKARVISHKAYKGDYRILELNVPAITETAEPGQFVHIKVPRMNDAVLRRPFSIYRVDGETLSVLYKEVGRGTAAMAEIGPGELLSVVGPLGTGFPLETEGRVPLLVGGGYGVAPLYMLATRLERKGVLFVGGASAIDILCTEEFEKIGWDVRVATEDGSMGTKGLVTEPLDEWINTERSGEVPVFYSCGPDGLLRAVGSRAIAGDWTGWLSLDKHMGCGVGACLACVQKIKSPSGEAIWARVCKEGPVFEARDIVW